MTEALLKGMIIGDRYRIEKALRRVRSGYIYHAYDMKSGKNVIVKEFFPYALAKRCIGTAKAVQYSCSQYDREVYDWGLADFLELGRRLICLSNMVEIVLVTDIWKENNTAYMVMDYLGGSSSLKQITAAYGGKIPVNVLLLLLEPVVKAVGKIHKSGLIHGSLNPMNIMFFQNGDIKLVDFGRNDLRTGDKTVPIVPLHGFEAPEYFSPYPQIGTYTDVYGLCATMYYCLTGKVPPRADQRMSEDGILPPSKLGAEIPDYLEQAIMDGLHLSLMERIQNMDELWQRIYGAEKGRRNCRSVFVIPQEDGEDVDK